METISGAALRSDHVSHLVNQCVRQRRVLSETRARSFEIRRRIRERWGPAAFVKSYITEPDKRDRTSSSSAKPPKWQKARGKDDWHAEIKAVMGIVVGLRLNGRRTRLITVQSIVEPVPLKRAARSLWRYCNTKIQRMATRANPPDIDQPAGEHVLALPDRTPAGPLSSGDLA